MADRYRAFGDKYEFDPELPPELNLAAAIVRRAIADARRLRSGCKPSPQDSFWYNAEELTVFFRSTWCAILCGGNDRSSQLLEEVQG